MEALLLAAIITCYSPSDCVSPQYCSSERDGVVPGRCVDETIPEDEPEYKSADEATSSKATSSASIADPLPEKIEEVPLSASSSEERSEGDEEIDPEPSGFFQAIKNFWCFFFCK